jgi:uncharacterized protein (TIGR03435 family)
MATLLFSAKKICSSLSRLERRVATFYDLPGIPEPKAPASDIDQASGVPQHNSAGVKFRGKDGLPEIPPEIPKTAVVTFNGQTKMQAKNETMRQLAQTLESFLHSPVLDATGLDGEFDFTLAWVSEEVLARSQAGLSDTSAEPENTGPSIFTAVRQLGLKLERRRGPIKSFVIDRIERIPES